MRRSVPFTGSLGFMLGATTPGIAGGTDVAGLEAPADGAWEAALAGVGQAGTLGERRGPIAEPAMLGGAEALGRRATPEVGPAVVADGRFHLMHPSVRGYAPTAENDENRPYLTNRAGMPL